MHKGEASMPPAEFELAVTNVAFESAVTGIDTELFIAPITCVIQEGVIFLFMHECDGDKKRARR
jgi:hypothetical protein